MTAVMLNAWPNSITGSLRPNTAKRGWHQTQTSGHCAIRLDSSTGRRRIRQMVPPSPMMTDGPPLAFILGLDTPAGAYLARLLQARGQRVEGAAAQGASLLRLLGTGDDVGEVAPAEAAAAAALAGTVYLVSGEETPPSLADAVLASASGGARIIHVVDHQVLRANLPAMRLSRQIVTMRQGDGRFAANAILHPHGSRLGRADALPARLTLAAFEAAKSAGTGTGTARLALADSAPQDWGWTPEYVDAVARLAMLPQAIDVEIGSGVAMTAHTMADHAGRWFKLDPDAWLHRLPADGADAAAAIDTGRLKALLGWRAYTKGGELIAALCEAAAERQAALLRGG